MSRPNEKDLGRVPHDVPYITALGDMLASVRPGDRIVYYCGPAGSATTPLKDAANALFEAGVCTLAQRPTGRKIGNARIWEYMAIKLRGHDPRAR